MQLKRRERGATTLAGVAGLLALFAALCAIFVAVVTFFEWRDERARQDWVPAIAIAERGGAEGTGGTGDAPTYFHLRYRVHFEANGQRQVVTVTSHASPVREVADAMQEWAELHKVGSEIAIRFDPAQPSNAEFDPVQTPGAGSRMNSNLTLLAITVVACVVLLPIARFMAARERAQVPVADAPPSGRSVGWGIFCISLGALEIGIWGYRALTASGGIAPDSVLVIPAGSIFIFAGVLLALPPGRENLRRLLVALLMTAFAMCFDWIAFGAGERQFSGAVSLGALTMGAGNPGEWLGRGLFGIGGLIATVVAIVAWVRVAQGALASR